MKKIFKAAMFAALVCFSSTLFAAAPWSPLKRTTDELFEEETMDNLAWGIEDADGVVLAGVDTLGSFNVAAGSWLGSFWYSIYDSGSFDVDKTSTTSVKNDAVAKDGFNTDYVDVTKSSDKQFESENDINNLLCLSFATGDWGLQAYWGIDDESGDDDEPYGKYSDSNEAHATGYTYKKDGKRGLYDATNTFGVNFKGIGVSEINDADLYFQLNNFEVIWDKESDKDSYKESKKLNGTAYDTTDYKKVDSKNLFTPSFTGEMGLNLSDSGSLATKFVLKETFSCSFGFTKDEVVETRVVEDFNTKTTTKTTTINSNNSGDYKFQWTNTLTPEFIFDFDVGERLSVKAKAGVGIALSSTPGDRNNTSTVITETTGYDKINKLTEKSYEKNVTLSGTNEQVTDTFKTSLSPDTTLAFVYQVKPEKFNLNFGLNWNYGTISWTTKTTKNETVKTSSYKEITNAAGGKTVVTDSVNYDRGGDTAASGDGRTEKKVTEFVADITGAPYFNLGATWFINEKVTMDFLYWGGFTSVKLMGNGSLLESNLGLMLSVKF